jgi:DnaJ domain
MPQFVIALIIVVGGLWFIRKLGRTPQAQMKPFLRKLAGGVIVGLAGLLALRGMMTYAVPLFVFGMGLMGQASMFPNGFPGGFPFGRKQAGQKSKVETALLSMELDHDTGAMLGTVRQGSFAGRALSSLSEPELMTFHNQCRAAPDQSQRLLEAWLDRHHAVWREGWGRGADTGEQASRSSGKMSREQALQVLGLKADASVSDIRAAHRRLMKDFHPDHGGSDYLAAQINEAKSVLMDT